MDEIPKLKTGDTQHRWLTAIKDKAFDNPRHLVVLETQVRDRDRDLSETVFKPLPRTVPIQSDSGNVC